MNTPDYLPDSMPESSPLADKQELSHGLDAAMVLLAEQRDALLGVLHNPDIGVEELRSTFIAYDQLMFEAACVWYVRAVELLGIEERLADSPERTEQTKKLVDSALQELQQSSRSAGMSGHCDTASVLARYNLVDAVASS